MQLSKRRSFFCGRKTYDSGRWDQDALVHIDHKTLSVTKLPFVLRMYETPVVYVGYTGCLLVRPCTATSCVPGTSNIYFYGFDSRNIIRISAISSSGNPSISVRKSPNHQFAVYIAPDGLTTFDSATVTSVVISPVPQKAGAYDDAWTLHFVVSDTEVVMVIENLLSVVSIRGGGAVRTLLSSRLTAPAWSVFTGVWQMTGDKKIVGAMIAKTCVLQPGCEDGLLYSERTAEFIVFPVQNPDAGVLLGVDVPVFRFFCSSEWVIYYVPYPSPYGNADSSSYYQLQSHRIGFPNEVHNLTILRGDSHALAFYADRVAPVISKDSSLVLFRENDDIWAVAIVGGRMRKLVSYTTFFLANWIPFSWDFMLFRRFPSGFGNDAALIESALTLAPSTPPTSGTFTSSPDSTQATLRLIALICGIVGGVLLLASVVIFVGCFVWKRKKKREAAEAKGSSQAQSAEIHAQFHKSEVKTIIAQFVSEPSRD